MEENKDIQELPSEACCGTCMYIKDVCTMGCGKCELTEEPVIMFHRCEEWQPIIEL